jgi:hypothetical protein
LHTQCKDCLPRSCIQRICTARAPQVRCIVYIGSFDKHIPKMTKDDSQVI